MKRLFITVLALGCFVASASQTYACFCVTPDVPEAFKQAKAVFLGEVVDITEPKNTDGSAPLADRLFTIRFKVRRSWKGVGVGVREFSVLAAQGGLQCFALPPARKGQTYLVYANPGPKAGNWSHITICGRTSVVRFGRPLNLEATDPYEDMKQLDAIANRIPRFNTARPRRRVNGPKE